MIGGLGNWSRRAMLKGVGVSTSRTGQIVIVPKKGAGKHPRGDNIQIDTKDILFTCGDAFSFSVHVSRHLIRRKPFQKESGRKLLYFTILNVQTALRQIKTGESSGLSRKERRAHCYIITLIYYSSRSTRRAGDRLWASLLWTTECQNVKPPIHHKPHNAVFLDDYFRSLDLEEECSLIKGMEDLKMNKEDVHDYVDNEYLSMNGTLYTMKINTFPRFISFIDLIKIDKLVYRNWEILKGKFMEMLEWFYMGYLKQEVLGELPPVIGTVKEVYKEHIVMVKIYYEEAKRSRHEEPRRWWQVVAGELSGKGIRAQQMQVGGNYEAQFLGKNASTSSCR
ncbi:ARID DNA-binding domain-containing protein [Tanacetum coccineum]